LLQAHHSKSPLSFKFLNLNIFLSTYLPTQQLSSLSKISFGSLS